MWELLHFGAFSNMFLQILLCVTGDTEEVTSVTAGAVVAEGTHPLSGAEGRSCCTA